jgi:hypothetical protein
MELYYPVVAGGLARSTYTAWTEQGAIRRAVWLGVEHVLENYDIPLFSHISLIHNSFCTMNEVFTAMKKPTTEFARFG